MLGLGTCTICKKFTDLVSESVIVQIVKNKKGKITSVQRVSKTQYFCATCNEA